MHKRYPFFIVSLISLACVTSSFAAQPIDLKHKSVSALQSFIASPSALAAGSRSTLKQISSEHDFNNATHIRVQQMYADHPVWGGDIVVHIPEGGNSLLAHLSPDSTMNGVVYQGLNIDLNNTPASALNSDQANKALLHGLKLYQKKTGIQKYDETTTKNELIVFVDKNNKAHWAYVVRFLTKATNEMPALPTYILDAVSFSVYEEWDDIQTLEDVKGSGFGGNPKMGKLTYDGLSGNYPVLNMQRDAEKNLCYLKNANVQVKDDNHKGPFGNASIAQFKCDSLDEQHGNTYWNGDLDAANGAYSPANDALYIGQVIQEMYQKWYGIPALSMFGMPMKINMHVHTRDPDGRAMENAYFLNLNNEMYFGDGLSMFYPLTSLGVGAHEVSHGFTAQHSKLVYQRQSGGLNESFSDMAAQAAEFYSTGQNTWLIGADIVKGEGTLRYMDEPSKDGRSISHMKNYYDGLDVHFTSGIFNKVFYLLGTSKNWDTKKAFDVMVKANMHYWTSTVKFEDAACGVIKATQDYKYDVEAVIQAMDGVGIVTSHC